MKSMQVKILAVVVLLVAAGAILAVNMRRGEPDVPVEAREIIDSAVRQQPTVDDYDAPERGGTFEEGLEGDRPVLDESPDVDEAGDESIPEVDKPRKRKPKRTIRRRPTRRNQAGDDEEQEPEEDARRKKKKAKNQPMS